MSIEVIKLTEAQLRALIENHRKKGATSSATFVEALRELEKRTGKGLDFDKSFSIIRDAARQGRFLSYKDLAEASGADWNQVHYSVGRHLGNLVEFSYRRGWPMLSAIVVNKPNVASGKMEPETMKGFIQAARDLGYTIIDETAFLQEQQQKVFEWARE